MEVFLALVILLVFGSFLVYTGMFILSFLDDISIALFQKPLYIHLYIKRKKITAQEEFVLRQQFEFYRKLSDKHKAYFHHRLASFTEKYEFIPREGFQVTHEVQTLIAGTYVMLTFGMRRYLVDAFDKIILYPEEYYSNHSEDYHKGEFNPRLKTVVFSWKHFTEGYQVDNDNLNLGIHEFSHVIHHHSLRNNDGSSLSFRKHYDKLYEQVNHPPNRQRLIDSDYFRIYAFTNQFEFISVIVEHYFETPEEFQLQFPELFNLVSKMLNHKH
ncbi:zinc-dependent peptidase [Flavobacterium sp.]|jgi:Mlc titration factor MtfA (ptsG expression regulator)|uniref:zinc-dependent peptidase n=1 Tax=Flavobacterium sp. TaxID=239 RepID=UPI0037BFDB8E